MIAYTIYHFSKIITDVIFYAFADVLYAHRDIGGN